MVKKRNKNKKGKKPKKAASSQKPLKPEELIHRTRIRVIGVGGGGGSVVSEIAHQLKKIDFVVANTDAQALKGAGKKVKTFQFGQKITRGLGSGMDPRLGQKAAREERDRIAKLFNGIDLCVLVATFGGGTGSGAAPEFARIAREEGVMTFGIFTLPFKFEGGRKIQIAKSSLEKITPQLNAFCVIPNENIFKIIEKSTPIKEAFSAINRRLSDNLKGLIETIYLPGLINIDWADLRTVLDGRGKLSYLNSAIFQGPNRAEEAVKNVLKSPLNEYGILGAEKIIYNITASQNLGMKEVEHISQTISDFNKRAKIIFGVSQDNNYKDKIRIVLLGVGCGEKPKSKPKSQTKPRPQPKLEPETEIKQTSLPESKPSPEPKIKLKPKPKLKPEAKQKISLELKSEPKPKLKPKPKSKTNPGFNSKSDLKHKLKVEPKLLKSVPEANKAFARKNALDLRKEMEKTEKDLLEREKQWDIPAFLRKKTETN